MSSEKSKYRAAVFGCGKVGVLYEKEPLRPKPASHAGVIEANPKTELIALVDTRTLALGRAGKIFPRARLYSSAEECLAKDRPDIVVIATGPKAHFSLIKLCLKYSVKAIICEKPLAQDARGGAEIANLIFKSRVIFILNYQRRFSPLFEKTHRAIAAAKLGRIQQVTCYYSNGLYNNGGHAIDAILFLLGEKLKWAAGFLNKKNKTRHAYDSNIDAILESESGARIVLQSFDQEKYGIHEFHIYGEKAGIAIVDYGDTLIWKKVRPSIYSGEDRLDWQRAAIESVVKSEGALQEAIMVLEKGGVPRSGVENGIETLCVLDVLRKSAQQGGKRIKI